MHKNRLFFKIAAVFLFALALAGCRAGGVALPSLTAPWPAASEMFLRDASWRGGDGASSVALPDGKVLWFFGDSFVCPDSSCIRADSMLVRNSVGVQAGRWPETASMSFYWGKNDGLPAAFFEESGGNGHNLWLWPGGAVFLDGQVLLFLMRIKQDENPLGFEVDGWSALLVQNPSDPPPNWRIRRLEAPQNDFGVLVGSGPVFKRDNFVYAFGISQDAQREAHLVRWKAADAAAGDLSAPAWRDDLSWTAQQDLKKPPKPLFENGQNEFALFYDESVEQWIILQTIGFGRSPIAMRTAKRFTGPWSEAVPVYAPSLPENSGLLVYGVRAHPLLDGPCTAVTYCTNTTDFQSLVSDESLYYPRFMRICYP
ncbi:MAG: DUF4185 domain-containing protein [Desulfatibacillaceae bacterium]|nr:DUF4185 domain-containing protein [Desulfatibacillaceae bacterium]